MKKYLRFGKIPPQEKSVNFINLSLDDNSDFSYYLKLGLVEHAYNCIPEKCYEIGVSVFELDKDENPILSNEKLKSDYEHRSKCDKIKLIVTGTYVGFGYDGEPLIKNVRILQKLENEEIIPQDEQVGRMED